MRELRVLPLRGLELQPDGHLTITLGAPGLRAIDAIESEGAPRLVVALRQHDVVIDDPALSDLSAVGTTARLVEVTHARLDDEPTVATLEGLERVRVLGEVATCRRNLRAPTPSSPPCTRGYG